MKRRSSRSQLRLPLLRLPAAPTRCAIKPTRRAAFAYPPTQRIAHVDVYHGTRVADPYRWLEHATAARRGSGSRRENALAQPYLEAIPARETIKKRLTQLWNYERYDIPVQARRPLLLSAQRRPAEPERAVRRRRASTRRRACCSIRTRSARMRRSRSVNSCRARTASCSPTACPTAAPTGAPGISATLRPARDLPDVLRFIKFAPVAWTADSRSLYYARYPAARRRRRRRHASSARSIGTSSERSAAADQRVIYKVDGPSHAQSVRADLRRRPLPGHLAVRRLATDRHLLSQARRGRRAVRRGRAAVRHLRCATIEFVAEIDDVFYVRTTDGCAECAADRRAGDVGRARRTGAS